MDTNRIERQALLSAQLAGHIDYLHRFARSRVRDDDLAADAVQETLLAALESAHRFNGEARVRTWLTGILLHKIHDRFRRESREPVVREVDIGEDGADFLESHPAEAPGACPERALANKQLGAAMGRALAALPPRQKDAFLMKEVAGLETEHMARLLGVNHGNLWVLVHRARANLQASLAREGYSPA